MDVLPLALLNYFAAGTTAHKISVLNIETGIRFNSGNLRTLEGGGAKVFPVAFLGIENRLEDIGNDAVRSFVNSQGRHDF